MHAHPILPKTKVVGTLPYEVAKSSDGTANGSWHSRMVDVR